MAKCFQLLKDGQPVALHLVDEQIAREFYGIEPTESSWAKDPQTWYCWFNDLGFFIATHFSGEVTWLEVLQQYAAHCCKFNGTLNGAVDSIRFFSEYTIPMIQFLDSKGYVPCGC